MKLGLDLDGVVIDYHSWFIEDFNAKNGTNLTLQDWTDYEFTKSGKNLKDIWDIIQKHSITGGFIHPKEIPGAIHAIRQLSDKYTIHIITYRLNHSRQDAITWLDRYRVPFDSISFTKDKAKMAYILGCDIMIEDDLKNARAVANIGIETLLYDRPYNQSDIEPLIQRVKSWDEILNIL